MATNKRRYLTRNISSQLDFKKVLKTLLVAPLVLSQLTLSHQAFAAEVITDDNGKIFRDVFRGAMAESKIENKVEDNGLKTYDQLTYLLPPDLADLLKQGGLPTSQADAAESLRKIGQQFADRYATDLFHVGREAGGEDLIGKVNQKLASKNVTLIIVPGYVGEWAAVNPFSEVVNDEKSEYAKQFQKNLDNSSDKSIILDSNFDMSLVTNAHIPVWRRGMDLENLNSVAKEAVVLGGGIPLSAIFKTPTFKQVADDYSRFRKSQLLDKYFDAGSIDVDGKAQVKAVIFTNPAFSLESVQNIEDTAQIYLRRLNKYIELMNQKNEEYIILGYSRGTPIALEMLARANEDLEKYPWLKQMKAMVSMGGVVYGSAIADLYLQGKLNSRRQASEGTKEFKTLAAVNGYIDGAYNLSLIDPQPLIELLEGSDKDGGSLPAFNLRATLEMKTELGIVTPQKIALLAEKAFDGILGMTTKARLDWWRKNTLPKNVVYYGMPAVMAGPIDALKPTPGSASDLSLTAAISDQDYKALANSEVAYEDSRSADNKQLKGNYKSYVEATSEKTNEGIQALNDSQMALYKVVFWPKINAQLNSSYKSGYKTKLLGVVGTHHWGIAYTHGLNAGTNMKQYYNNFPRTAFLKAIVGTVVLDLN